MTATSPRFAPTLQPDGGAEPLSQNALVARARQPVAQPTVPLQLIDEDGVPTLLDDSIGIDVGLARSLHADMVLARRLDHEALALQRQGELHLWLMSWGQEAAQVGSVRALRDSDTIFPSYREHAVALCRRISPADIMRQWRGVDHSGWDPAESKVHINSLVLGTQTLHATGYAAGVRLDRSDEVVMTYFGDGSASQGDVNEALNWAAAGSLPVVFFCQNNQWAISTPTSKQMRTSLHVRAAGFGLAGYHVDGNDALAVHAVTQDAVARVRAGGPPALIEAQTYRMAGHSSSDDPKRYRTDAELSAWQAKDPVLRLERFLRRAGVEDSHFTDLKEKEEAFGATVREECKALTGDGLDAVFDQSYAEPHPVMETEKSQYLARREQAVA